MSWGRGGTHEPSGGDEGDCSEASSLGGPTDPVGGMEEEL